MSRLADAALFDGAPGAWYRPAYPRVAGETAHYALFVRRADAIFARWPAAQKVLVAGCGPGWTVLELSLAHRYADTNGEKTWGCDASQFIVDRGKSDIAPVRDRILVGDALSAGSLRQVKSNAGIGNKSLFDVVVTEDLLTAAASEAEVAAMLTNLRGIGVVVAHVVTPGPAGPLDAPDVLWRTPAEWRALVGTDPLYDHMMREIP